MYGRSAWFRNSLICSTILCSIVWGEGTGQLMFILNYGLKNLIRINDIFIITLTCIWTNTSFALNINDSHWPFPRMKQVFSMAQTVFPGQLILSISSNTQAQIYCNSCWKSHDVLKVLSGGRTFSFAESQYSTIPLRSTLTDELEYVTASWDIRCNSFCSFFFFLENPEPEIVLAEWGSVVCHEMTVA